MHEDDIDYGLPPRQLMTTMPPLLTIKQAAATGAGSDRMLRKMCADGRIKAIKVGSDWRILRDPFFEQFFLLS